MPEAKIGLNLRLPSTKGFCKGSASWLSSPPWVSCVNSSSLPQRTKEFVPLIGATLQILNPPNSWPWRPGSAAAVPLPSYDMVLRLSTQETCTLPIMHITYTYVPMIREFDPDGTDRAAVHGWGLCKYHKSLWRSCCGTPAGSLNRLSTTRHIPRPHAQKL